MADEDDFDGNGEDDSEDDFEEVFVNALDLVVVWLLEEDTCCDEVV